VTTSRALLLLLALLPSCATFEAGSEQNELTLSDPVFRGISGAFKNYEELSEPLDDEELIKLAHHPERDKHRLGILIQRAAADKNPSFRALLRRDALRGDPYFRPALAAYDYQLDGDSEALDVLTGTPARPWSNYIGAMAFADEWSKTIQAMEGYEKHVDGARGLDLAFFWIARERLFPMSYHRLKRRPDIRRLIEKRLGKDVRAKLDAHAPPAAHGRRETQVSRPV
jgi:hypothetical protein